MIHNFANEGRFRIITEVKRFESCFREAPRDSKPLCRLSSFLSRCCLQLIACVCISGAERLIHPSLADQLCIVVCAVMSKWNLEYIWFKTGFRERCMGFHTKAESHVTQRHTMIQVMAPSDWLDISP